MFGLRQIAARALLFDKRIKREDVVFGKHIGSEDALGVIRRKIRKNPDRAHTQIRRHHHGENGGLALAAAHVHEAHGAPLFYHANGRVVKLMAAHRACPQKRKPFLHRMLITAVRQFPSHRAMVFGRIPRWNVRHYIIEKIPRQPRANAREGASKNPLRRGRNAGVGDALGDSDKEKIHDERRTAVGDKRQRDAGDRQEADRAADIQHDLREK